MPKYRVTFTFNSGIRVTNKITAYPALGVKIGYQDNDIKSVTHIYEDTGELTHDERLRYSTSVLRLFWEILEYRHGLPIKPSSYHSEIIDKPKPSTGTVEMKIDALICSEVMLPEESVLVHSTLRLVTWLHDLNDANNTRSDQEAIKLYYGVWEDMKGRPIEGDPAVHLKYTRDFVSHREELKNQDLLKFLESEIGKGTTQYEPTNPAHQAFVRRQRKQARLVVETEINKVLQ